MYWFGRYTVLLGKNLDHVTIIRQIGKAGNYYNVLVIV
jgi:hypothetical protein